MLNDSYSYDERMHPPKKTTTKRNHNTKIVLPKKKQIQIISSERPKKDLQPLFVIQVLHPTAVVVTSRVEPRSLKKISFPPRIQRNIVSKVNTLFV